MEQKPYEILNRSSVEEFRKKDKVPARVVLDNVRSGLNVGAVFRSADAFGIIGINLCGITVSPPHREILKTALGATMSVDWTYHAKVEDCITKLKQDGFRVMAVETATGATSLEHCTFDESAKFAFVFGNEVEGINNKVLALCDGAIEIPQVGTKHSFNISVSLGIVLWEYFRQFRKKYHLEVD